MSAELDQKDLAALWMAAARAGDFAPAWEISDRTLAQRAGTTCWHLPRHEQWVWDGRPVAGRRVLVRCYHGLGDTIQFARFLPELGRLAREAVVWAQPVLLPLLRTVPGARQVLPLHDGAPSTDYEVDLEIMELAHALRVTLDCLPTQVPYFCVPFSCRYTSAFSVGLVARAGDFNAWRSVPADLLISGLADLPVTVFGLQLGGLAGTRDLSTSDDARQPAASPGPGDDGRYDGRPSGRCARRTHLDVADRTGRLALDGRSPGLTLVPDDALVSPAAPGRLGVGD
jgi:hypothetical protein